MLKYQKGTFIVVPDIERLSALPAVTQALFMWLCKHADEDGICFPSRKKLAGLLHCDMRTVDRHIILLEQGQFVIKTKRRKKGDKTNKSNLYQIIVKGDEQGDINAEQGDTNDTYQVDTDVPVTQSNINSIHLTQSLPAKPSSYGPFIFIEKMEQLKVSKWKPDKIIHLYFNRKNLVFENKKQWDLTYGRFKKSAIALEGYSSDQIWQAFDYCDSEMKNIPWTLETIVKVISNVVNRV